MTAIGGMPGHWRKTTSKQRAWLYIVVFAIMIAFTVFLWHLWDHFVKTHDDIDKDQDTIYKW